MRPSDWIEAHVEGLRGRRDELIVQRDRFPRRVNPERMADREARVEEVNVEIMTLQGMLIWVRSWEEAMERKLEHATISAATAASAVDGGDTGRTEP